MSSAAQPLHDAVLTVVGDPDGVFVRALEREGVHAVGARLDELGQMSSGHILLVGKSAIDGGRRALANAPEGTQAIVVLPRGAAGSRIAACTLGVHVVDQGDDGPPAKAVVASLAESPSPELGCTNLGALLDVVGERVARQLGGRPSRGMQLRVGEAERVTALIDEFASDLAALCRQTERPPQLGPGVAVAQLSWDDDPQTLQQESAEVARWRRLSARGVAPKMIQGLEKGRFATGEWSAGDSEPPSGESLASEVREALRDGSAGRLPVPGRLPSGVLPQDIIDEVDDLEEDLEKSDLEDAGFDDMPTASGAEPLPLIWRQDPDIGETAPHDAIPVGGLPTLEAPAVAFEPDSGSVTLKEDRSPRPARPSALEAEVAAVEPKARKSRLPLVFGLGVITLSGIAGVGFAGLLAFSGSDVDPSSGSAQAVVVPPALDERVLAEAVSGGGESASDSETASDSDSETASDSASASASATASETATVSATASETATATVSASAFEGASAPSDPQQLRASSDVLVANGRRAARAGDWESAREAFEAALVVYEPNPHAHAELARERVRANDAIGALPHAERAVALRRLRAEYFVLLGDVHRIAEDVGAARRAYERAILLDHDNAAARRALGRR